MNSVGELFVCRYVWQVASVSCTRGLTWPARPLSFSLVVVSSIEASIQTSHVHVRSALYLFHQWAEMDTECMQDPFPGRRSARPRNAQWQNPGEEGREGNLRIQWPFAVPSCTKSGTCRFGGFANRSNINGRGGTEAARSPSMPCMGGDSQIFYTKAMS